MHLDRKGPVLQGFGRDLVDGGHPRRVSGIDPGVDDSPQGEAHAETGCAADVGVAEAGSTDRFATL